VSASLIIVTYKTGSVLRECLDAAGRAEGVGDIVIVDNGNPAGDTQIIDAFAAQNSYVRVLRGQGNVGFAKACNLGAAKTQGDPLSLTNSVRGVLNGLDRELPVFDTQTLDQRVEKSLVSRKSPVLLSLTFGVVALCLSAIGIYGVLAYLVTQRRKEIGIRIALGSSGRAIFDLVLREGLILIAGGFVVGAIGALVLRKSLESQLFGVSAADPVVLIVVTAILAVVAITACAVPARRATQIDPIVALSE